MQQEPIPLAEAALLTKLDKIESFAFIASEFAERYLEANQANPLKLTEDEIAAIYLYTAQWTSGVSLFTALNNALRTEDRNAVRPFFPYLRLLLGGLRKLPVVNRPVFRGVKLPLYKDYTKGKKVCCV